MRNLGFILFLFSGVMFLPRRSNAQNATPTIDWPAFMSEQDMVWTTLPDEWTKGPFMGNGLMGAMIYTVPDSNAIRIDMGRSDYTDHRDSTYGMTAFSKPRLPVGYFLIRPVGKIQKQSTMRLDLWNAETRANIVTDKGSIKFTAYVHSDKMLLVLNTQTTGAESGFKFEFVPQAAVSPRHQYGLHYHEAARIMKNYQYNPNPLNGKSGDVFYSVQKLLAGGETTTSWRKIVNDGDATFIINSTHTYPQNNSTSVSESLVKSIDKGQLSALQSSHEWWWHNYYPESFVSLPDATLESFYWIQMYKMASATRADRPFIDDEGPWLEESSWPYATWNLNVELTYWSVYTANRSELGMSLLNAMWNNRNNLRNNIPLPYREGSYGIGRGTALDLVALVGVPGNKASPPEVGLLTWACHNLWLQYRHTMDKQMLSNKLYPLLKGSINYYLKFIKSDDNGYLHLPMTFSPEFKPAEDANFDLALMKWGCKTLMNISDILHVTDPQYAQWKDVVAHITPYPRDSTGFMIGKNVPLNVSHRHFSHLLMIYPLYDINIDQLGSKAVIQKSLDHWQGMRSALQGYSFTGGSSISSAIGDGDRALSCLNNLIFGGLLHPNTMYTEGHNVPVIETPLSGAQSIQDMLLQSWGDKIRVFPAVPGSWKNVAYADLSAEGGFLISAKRENGKTVYVRVKSQAGEPCIIKTDMEKPMINKKLTKIAEGTYIIDLKKGEEAVIYAATNNEHSIIGPVPKTAGKINNFGLN